MAIKDYYKKLSRAEKTEFIYGICKICDISIPAAYKKLLRGFRGAEETLIRERLMNQTHD